MLARLGSPSRSALAAAAVLILFVAFCAGRATVRRPGLPVVPGPLRVIDGVGVGFAHSQAGADAAAAHYLLEIERAMDTLDAAADIDSRIARRDETARRARSRSRRRR